VKNELAVFRSTVGAYVLPILIAYFVDVLLAFARDTKLCPSGVTLSLLRNVVSLTMCCAVRRL